MATRQGNRAGRSIVSQKHFAALSGEFGMRMLRTKFPNEADEILKELGTFTRGPRKGSPRGYIHWEKIVEGGFDYERRMVVGRGTREWDVLRDDYADSESVLRIVCLRRAKESDRLYDLGISMLTPEQIAMTNIRNTYRHAQHCLREHDRHGFRMCRVGITKLAARLRQIRAEAA